MSTEKNTIKSEFIRILREISSHENDYPLFRDFIFLSSFSLQNVMLKSEEIEERYKAISSNYTKKQLLNFSGLLGLVTEALDSRINDFLGDIYMSLNLGNKKTAQFYTPYNLALLISRLTIEPEKIKSKSFSTVHDPACGAGCMLIAFYDSMLKNNINPQEKMLAYGKDIDPLSARMCFIQLSLLGVPAVIEIGDTLKKTTKERLYTTFYWLNSHKYRKRPEPEKHIENKDLSTAEYIEIKKELRQLELI